MHATYSKEGKSDIIFWINQSPTKPTCKARTFGYIGFVVGLLSSASMVFLGNDFFTRLGMDSQTLSYSLAILSSTPLALLYAQVCKKVFLQACSVKGGAAATLFKKPKPHSCLKRITLNIVAILFSLTTTLPLTYLSHLKFIEKTNLVCALVFDVFSFLPKIILFKFSLEKLYTILTNYMLQKIQKCKAITENIESAESIKAELEMFFSTRIRTVEMLPANEVAILCAHVRQQNNHPNIQQLAILIQAIQPLKNLNSPQSFFVALLVEALVLFTSFCGSYVMVPLGCGAYQIPFSGINLTSSTLLACNTSSFPEDEIGTVLSLAWLGCFSFMSLLNFSIRQSLGKFILSGQQARRACSTKKIILHIPKIISSDHDGTGQYNDKGVNLYCPIIVMLLAASLAAFSSFPRIEVISEDVSLSNFMNLALKIAAGIGFFCMDFWPLTMCAALMTGEGDRQTLLNMLERLRESLPKMSDKSIFSLKNEIDNMIGESSPKADVIGENTLSQPLISPV